MPCGAPSSVELLGHLQRELAGRDEDERGRRRLVGAEPLDDRQAEGERLARAGRRLGRGCRGRRARRGRRASGCGTGSVMPRAASAARPPRSRRARRNVWDMLVFDSLFRIREPRLESKEEREPESHGTTRCRPCNQGSSDAGQSPSGAWLSPSRTSLSETGQIVCVAPSTVWLRHELRQLRPGHPLLAEREAAAPGAAADEQAFVAEDGAQRGEGARARDDLLCLPHRYANAAVEMRHELLLRRLAQVLDCNSEDAV